MCRQLFSFLLLWLSGNFILFLESSVLHQLQKPAVLYTRSYPSRTWLYMLFSFWLFTSICIHFLSTANSNVFIQVTFVNTVDKWNVQVLNSFQACAFRTHHHQLLFSSQNWLLDFRCFSSSTNHKETLGAPTKNIHSIKHSYQCDYLATYQ